MILNDKLRQIFVDATGKWAFHLPMFYFAAPLSILASVLQDFDPHEPRTFWLWLSASLIGFIAMLLVALMAKSRLFQSQQSKRIPVPFYVLLTFLIGGTKGGATGFVGGLLVDTTSFDNALAPRIVTSGLIAVFVIPAGSVFLASRERFALARDALISEAVQIESLTRQNTFLVSDLPSIAQLNSDSELGSQIKNLLQEIAQLKTVPAESQWELISTGLKRIVNENIRPISKALWQDKQRTYPALAFRDLISLSIRQFHFPMWFVIGANIFGTTGQFLRHSQNQSLILTLTWTSLSIAIPYVLFQFLVKKKILSGSLSLLLLLSCAISLETIRLELDSASSTSGITIFFNSMIFGIFLTATLLTSGVVFTAVQSQSEVISKLSTLVDQDRIALIASNIKTESTNREVAKFLHGHLQTRLMSMALALEMAGKNSDFEKVQKTIQEIELELDIPIDRISPQHHRSIYEVIEHISNVWGGLVQIEHQVQRDFPQIDSVTLENIATILEEAVTNAVRHGLATQVSIEITQGQGANLSIQVTDNGTGLNSSYSGLGTGLITSICGSNWSISNVTNGTGVMLLARVPLS